MGNFVVGDVVVHKGQIMTIHNVIMGDKYTCVWFSAKGRFARADFHAAQLISMENYNKILLKKQRDRTIGDILNDYDKIYRL